ncbi:hypothetical protein OS493_029896 [Desmophyllum pertusum]|uniref:DNA excision repair protein ERCC-6-like 2 n=1 Tax=Desmophyllum pertusum TaxID=174260 RepID=A0A9W9Y8R8_9CNID|nr:hypothetical protein OS493_029896 [Desmophyllum pertusum]
MDFDGSTTDDDCTEDEEDTKRAVVACGNNVNNGDFKTRCQSDFKLEGKDKEAKCSDMRVEVSSASVTPSTTERKFFFNHLKGNETEEIMRLKYGEYDASSDSNTQERMDSKGKSGNNHIKTKVSVSSSKEKKKGKLNVSSVQCNKKLLGSRAKNKKNASPIIQEAKKVYKRIQHAESLSETPCTSTRPQNTSFDDAINKKSDGENELDDDMIADGFDDQDMERPSFSEPAVHPSVPLLLSPPDVHPVIQIPATINRYLRDYQRDGARFLYQHYSDNTGAILGDDMGLGKTVQVISFIAAILGKTGTKADIFCKFMDSKVTGKQQGKVSSHDSGAFLIVSPGSVMYNWRDELVTWGHFKTGIFHANAREATLERALRGRLDIVLTTYETMRNHLNDLNQIKWLAVIMDEVHRLKDPKAKITVAAKALGVKRRYGLTGTPLQNKLEEFWCVLDWAKPGSLGLAKKFKVEFDKPIRKGQPYDATKRELAIARKKSKDLQNKIGSFFLRRTKDLIADQLPKKDELVVFCPLTPFQEDVYQTLLQNPDVELIRKKNFPCDCGSGEDRGKCCYTLSSESEDIKTVTMRFFQLLLKVANHAALLAPTVKQTEDQQEKAKELCLRVFARYPEFSGGAEMSSFELLSDPKYCGKIESIREDVASLSRGTQQITSVFKINTGLVYSRLDGKTKPVDRPRVVHEFNVDPSISLCLISTKAGGLGLNFTGANVVIIFDPNWNPSSDLQTQDRAYRIGQRRDVSVYRLISSGTIEEMMYLRQVYKQQLANIAVGGTNERRYFTGVEGDKDKKGELFGLENLFSYRAEGASLSKDIVRRTEKLEAGYKVTKYEIVHDKKQEDGLKSEATGGTVNPNLEEDPYNLEEIASQLIDDGESRKQTHSTSETTQNSVIDLKDKSSEKKLIGNHTASCSEETRDFTKDGCVGMENKGINYEDDDILYELDNSQLCLSDDDGDDFLAKFLDSPRKHVSFELSPSSDDEDLESNKLTNNFTRLKEKPSTSYMKIHGSLTELATEESCDIISPTASFGDVIKSRIYTDVHSDDEDSFSQKEDQRVDFEELSDKSSASEDEDSIEGLFSNSKRKRLQRVGRKRRPAASIPFTKARTALLEEGRSQFRRFPGQKAPSLEVDSKTVTVAKRSRKENTVEEILESCGVRYTHANRHIVGPSEAENHMSKLALQDVFELRQFSQQPANCFPALETSDESDDLGESTHDKNRKSLGVQRNRKREAAMLINHPCTGTEISYVTSGVVFTKPKSSDSGIPRRSNNTGLAVLTRSITTDDDVTMERIGNSTIFIGSTPRGIRRQHFREMSDVLGFSSEVDLAKAVVDSSENERREMLARYYVDKNPVLSGLSSFTARERTSSVENLKGKQVVEGGKRSLVRRRRENSHGTSKRATKILQKRNSKPLRVKAGGNDKSSEGNRERLKIHRPAGESKSRSKMFRCTEKALEGKQSVHHESSVNDAAMNEEEVHSVDTRNCGLAVTTISQLMQKDPNCPRSTASKSVNDFVAETQSSPLKNTTDISLSVTRTRQLEQKDLNCPSTAPKSNDDFVAETQISSLKNTSDFSVSILDEFLLSDSSRGVAEIEDSGRRVGKRKQCSSQKEDKQLHHKTKGKEPIKLKKTSVLDEFI